MSPLIMRRVSSRDFGIQCKCICGLGELTVSNVDGVLSASLLEVFDVGEHGAEPIVRVKSVIHHGTHRRGTRQSHDETDPSLPEGAKEHFHLLIIV